MVSFEIQICSSEAVNAAHFRVTLYRTLYRTLSIAHLQDLLRWHCVYSAIFNTCQNKVLLSRTSLKSSRAAPESN